MCILVLCSCADVSENEENGIAKSSSRKFSYINNDIDFDGLQNKFDTNPKISNFPIFSIENVSGYQLGYSTVNKSAPLTVTRNYDLDSLNKLKQCRISYLKSKFSTLHFNRSVLNVETYDESNVVDILDNYTFFINEYEPEFLYDLELSMEDVETEKVEGSGFLSFSFNFSIDSLEETTEVYDIIVGVYVYDTVTGNTEELDRSILKSRDFSSTAFQTVPNTKFVSNQLNEIVISGMEMSTISKILNPTSSIIVKILDYSFVRSGKTYKFSELYDLAKSNLTNFSYFDGDKYHSRFVTKDLWIEKVFELLDLNGTFRDGRLVSNGKMNSSLIYPFIPSRPDNKNLSNGIWEIVGSRDSKTSLNSSENVFVSFSTGVDLMNVNSEMKTVVDSEYKDDDEILINGVFPNQEYVIDIQGRRETRSVIKEVIKGKFLGPSFVERTVGNLKRIKSDDIFHDVSDWLEIDNNEEHGLSGFKVSKDNKSLRFIYRPRFQKDTVYPISIKLNLLIHPKFRKNVPFGLLKLFDAEIPNPKNTWVGPRNTVQVNIKKIGIN